MREAGAQLTLAPQAGSAHYAVRRKLIKACVLIGDQGIARIFTRRNCRQGKSFRHIHWYILHRVHGNIRATVLKRLFQLFDEQSLAADFREGYVKNLISARRHAKYAEFGLRV